jgi:hypothetical protein
MDRAIKLIRAWLIASVLILTFTARANPLLDTGGDHGGSHPWPWGLEVPFPWEDIQGIWKINTPGKAVYLGVRRLELKRLAVTQFDLDLCAVTASGPGLEKANTVVTQMNEVGSRNVYRMTLYAFDPQSNPARAGARDRFEPTPVMVARIVNLSLPSPEIAFQMVKISEGLEIHCVRQNKNLRF